MVDSNIAKKFGFVIVFLIVAILAAGCSRVSSSDGATQPTANQNSTRQQSENGKPEIIGTITSNEIKESSGIAQSVCQQSVLWTHNDSGDGSFIFAIDLKGKKLGTFKIPNAKNIDWEDIAAYRDSAGECFLYIGDIGNNLRKRNPVTVYKIREPSVTNAKNSDSKNPVLTEKAEAIELKYPDEIQDAETLMIHPQTGDLYVLTKRLDAPSGVYKVSADYKTDSPNTLKKNADFKVPAIPNGFLTGGDISSDGKRIVVCDYFAAYEIELPKTSKSFDEIWKQTPVTIQLGERAQGEACGYSADGKSIYATSEKANSPLIRVKIK